MNKLTDLIILEKLLEDYLLNTFYIRAKSKTAIEISSGFFLMPSDIIICKDANHIIKLFNKLKRKRIKNNGNVS